MTVTIIVPLYMSAIPLIYVQSVVDPFMFGHGVVVYFIMQS